MSQQISRTQMRELLTGKPPENLSCLALKILLGRLRIKAKTAKSSHEIEPLVDSLEEFFIKNQNNAARDKSTLFGAIA